MSKPTKRTGGYSVIPKQHYEAIGRAVCTWADLELTVDRAVWKLMNAEQALGACVTGQLNSIFARLDALQALAYLWNITQARRDKIAKFAGGLGDLNRQRNRIVHDARFWTERTKVARFEITAKKTLQFGLLSESVTDLNGFCKSVDEKRDEFLSIFKEIYQEFEKKRQYFEKQPSGFRLPFPRIVMNDLD